MKTTFFCASCQRHKSTTVLVHRDGKRDICTTCNDKAATSASIGERLRQQKRMAKLEVQLVKSHLESGKWK